MLKKAGAAAKDRLKQGLHQVPPIMSRGHAYHHGRAHKHSAPSPSVSLKSVDNSIFEQILDDDSDFIGEGQDHQYHPPPPPPPSTDTSSKKSLDSQSAPHPLFSSDNENDDLFDSDMFRSVDEDEGSDEYGSTPPSALVNYDPLSGQIVSDPLPPESSQGDGGGLGSETEVDPGDGGGVGIETEVNPGDGGGVGGVGIETEVDPGDGGDGGGLGSETEVDPGDGPGVGIGTEVDPGDGPGVGIETEVDPGDGGGVGSETEVDPGDGPGVGIETEVDPWDGKGVGIETEVDPGDGRGVLDLLDSTIVPLNDAENEIKTDMESLPHEEGSDIMDVPEVASSDDDNNSSFGECRELELNSRKSVDQSTLLGPTKTHNSSTVRAASTDGGLFSNDDDDDDDDDGGDDDVRSHELLPSLPPDSSLPQNLEELAFEPIISVPSLSADQSPPSSTCEEDIEKSSTEIMSEVVSEVSREGPLKINHTPSPAESSRGDIKAELDLLLAPWTPPRSDAQKITRAARSRTRELSSEEKEGVDGNHHHLDSGVFEHDVVEQERGDGERDEEGGGKKEELLPIMEDYYKSSGRSRTGISNSERINSTHYSPRTARKIDTSSSSVTSHQPIATSSSKTATAPSHRPMASKRVPPPRPPISPEVQKRLNTNMASSVRASKTRESSLSNAHTVVPKHIRPLGKVKGQTVPEVDKKEERVAADDLFSDDYSEKTSHSPEKATTSANTTTAQIFATEQLNTTSTATTTTTTTTTAQITTTEQLNSATTTGQITTTERLNSSTSTTTTTAATERLNSSTTTTTGQTATTECTSPEEPEEAEPELTLPYHLFLSTLLYLYFSLNIFPYLAGLLAGFFCFFVFLGAIFIYYVHVIEKENLEKKRKEKKRKDIHLSEDFAKTMNVDFSKLKEYQSNKFTATLSYDASTHHPSHRMKSELKLYENFNFKIGIFDANEDYTPVFRDIVDIRKCEVKIEPPEVAENRKRRWSKKFPIVVSCKKFKVYLFSPTARDKEDWFRRIKSASNGETPEQVIAKSKEFFMYMKKYFPADATNQPSMYSKQRSSSLHQHRPQPQQHHHQQHHQHRRHHNNSALQPDMRVQFSKGVDEENVDEGGLEDTSGVNITKKNRLVHHQAPHVYSSQREAKAVEKFGSVDPTERNGGGGGGGDTMTSRHPPPSVDEMGFEHLRYPMKPHPSAPLDTSANHNHNQWLNSIAARLCWDVWHEKRWKDWIMTRIEKKLIRVKTPSFMEKLRLINIDIGNDMPMINRLIGGPRLNLRGIWIYLDVTYQGKFVMTIETKMKLGAKKSGGGGGGGGGGGEQQEGKQMTDLERDNGSLPMSFPHHTTTSSSSVSRSSRVHNSMNHTSAARALAGEGGKASDYQEVEIDSGSDDEEGSGQSHPLLEEDLAAKQFQDLLPSDHTPSSASPASTKAGANKGRIKSMVTRVAKKVVNTKIVRRAAEKVSSYPLVLTVEVNRLDGVLAVNIPPPPTDTVWFGFKGSPKLELVAKPKLGQREVKLSRITHWIEKKLCDIVDKKLVLPEMEDIVIPILNSGMAEDKQKPISSKSDSKS